MQCAGPTYASPHPRPIDRSAPLPPSGLGWLGSSPLNPPPLADNLWVPATSGILVVLEPRSTRPPILQTLNVPEPNCFCSIVPVSRSARPREHGARRPDLSYWTSHAVAATVGTRASFVGIVSFGNEPDCGDRAWRLLGRIRSERFLFVHCRNSHIPYWSGWYRCVFLSFAGHGFRLAFASTHFVTVEQCLFAQFAAGSLPTRHSRTPVRIRLAAGKL